MEEKRKGREKRGGVRIGRLGGGGGAVVLAGGALVAAAVWGVCEFRRRKKGSGKNGTLKEFETPSLEKVKDVEEGGNGLKLVLQNEKLDVDVHASKIEEKGSPVESDSSPKDVILDEGLGLQIDVEEKIEEGDKNQEQCENDYGSGGESIPVIQTEDDAVYEEAVDKVKQEAVEISDDSLDADAMFSVSEDELGPQVEDVSPVLEDTDVGIDDGSEASKNGIAKIVENEELVVHSMTPVSDAEDDNSDDVESEESESDEVSGESVSDVSEESSRETVDSSGESSAEAVWPAESMEEPSQVLKNDKNLNWVLEEIVEADDSEILNSANSIVNNIHGYESSVEGVRIYKETLGSAAKFDFQQVENSTKLRIWICLVTLALLVLVVAFLTRPEYVSPDLACSVSPF